VVGRRRGPLAGCRVELDLGQGAAELDDGHLEPVLESRAEAEELLARTLEGEAAEAAEPPTAPGANPLLALGRGRGGGRPRSPRAEIRRPRPRPAVEPWDELNWTRYEAVWQVELDHGWADCGPAEQIQYRRAKSGEGERELSFRARGQDYEVRLDEGADGRWIGTQLNLATGMERALRESVPPRGVRPRAAVRQV
jgi:hypothetical protein